MSLNSLISLKRSETNIWFYYILVFLLLCYSGNPYFIFASNAKMIYVLMAGFAFLLGIMSPKMKIARVIIYVLPIALILFLHSINNSATSNANLFVLLKIIIGGGIITYLGERFIYVYLDIIKVLTIISIICFSYNVFVGAIPSIPVTEVASSIVIYTQLPGNIEYGAVRNCGMFWEPGAYQGFLNLALLFLLLIKDYPRKKITAIILIAGVLTTQSTTGYVVLMCIGYLYISSQTNINSIQRILLLILLFAVSYYFYTGLDFLQDKIVDNLSNTDSSQGRVTDFVRYSSLILENILFGVGYQDIPSGNGFFSQLMAIGLVGIIYVYSVLIYKWGQQLQFKIAFLAVICLIVMYQGEVFTNLPLFSALLFVSFPAANIRPNYLGSPQKSITKSHHNYTITLVSTKK